MVLLKIELKNDELPPIKYTLSPAQMFQFQYTGYCSLFEADYFHDVTRFFCDVSNQLNEEVKNQLSDKVSLTDNIVLNGICYECKSKK